MILAVIALIATPIVLSIINDTKESAMRQSADFYISAVENAILREIQEELGVKSEIDRLISITESFFDMKDKTYHELGFNYLLRFPENSQLLKMQGEFAGVEGEKYRYKWVDKELLSQITFKPNYMVSILQNMPQEIVHIIKDERTRNKEDIER